MFTHHILFDHFQFAFIYGPNFPGSYTILLFTASVFTSITSHTRNWVLFLLWLRHFILSGIISPQISSSILGTYRPGEFIFKPFHTFHGALKARILKWFAIPFSDAKNILQRYNSRTFPAFHFSPAILFFLFVFLHIHWRILIFQLVRLVIGSRNNSTDTKPNHRKWSLLFRCSPLCNGY